MAMHGHLLDRFKDPDGDEERAKQLPRLRKERRERLKQQILAQQAITAAK